MDVNELEEYVLGQQEEEYNRYWKWVGHATYLVHEEKWTLVQLDYDIDVVSLQEWMEKSIKGRWDADWSSYEFVFENGADATWFLLNWKSK
jgi:hypothetical protein